MKKLLKGLLLSTMSVIMCTAIFTGCTNGNQTGITQIGIIQMAENGSFAEMRNAFIAEMTTLGFDESKVKITMENANGDISALTTAITKTANNCDIIIPMTTTPAVQTYSYLTSQGIEKPMIFMSVTNPVASGLMNTLENPDKNCTGSSNVIPTSTIFEFADSFKAVTKYGIIYDDSNSAAVNTANAAKAYLTEHNVPFEQRTAKATADIELGVTALINSGVDAIYVPLDTAMQTAMSNIINLTNAAKIPVYGSADVMVEKGALATIGVSYTKIGQLTAKMVAEYLNGKKISEIPAQALSEYSMAVNLSTASTLEIIVPADVLSNINLIKYGTAA